MCLCSNVIITDGLFVVDCAISDCDECIENIDNAVGECTKCTGTYVLDQGTCNDSKLQTNTVYMVIFEGHKFCRFRCKLAECQILILEKK